MWLWWSEKLLISLVVLPARPLSSIQGAQEGLHLLCLKFLAGIWCSYITSAALELFAGSKRY